MNADGASASGPKQETAVRRRRRCERGRGSGDGNGSGQQLWLVSVGAKLKLPPAQLAFDAGKALQCADNEKGTSTAQTLGIAAQVASGLHAMSCPRYRPAPWSENASVCSQPRPPMLGAAGG